MYVCMLCMYVCMYVCMHVCMCMCMCMCVCMAGTYACMCRLCLFLNMTCIGRAVGTACQRINTSLTTAQVDLCDTEGELKHLLKQPPDSYASKCLNYREKYVLIKIESKWHFTSVHESMPDFRRANEPLACWRPKYSSVAFMRRLTTSL